MREERHSDAVKKHFLLDYRSHGVRWDDDWRSLVWCLTPLSMSNLLQLDGDHHPSHYHVARDRVNEPVGLENSFNAEACFMHVIML